MRNRHNTQPFVWATDGDARAPRPSPAAPPARRTVGGGLYRAAAGSARAPGRDATASTTPLRDVMTRAVVTVDETMDLRRVRELVLDRGLSGLSVVDRQGAIAGFITLRDLLRHDGRPGVVADVMMPFAFTLPETATVAQAAALMAFEGIHRLPVLDGEGRLAGIVSAIDVMRWLALGEGFLVPPYTQAQREVALDDSATFRLAVLAAPGDDLDE